MKLKTDEVVETASKVRLDVYLSENLPDWTRSQIKLQIENGGVEVNGKQITKAGYLVKDGDKLSLNFETEFFLKIRPPDFLL